MDRYVDNYTKSDKMQQNFKNGAVDTPPAAINCTDASEQERAKKQAEPLPESFRPRKDGPGGE